MPSSNTPRVPTLRPGDGRALPLFAVGAAAAAGFAALGAATARRATLLPDLRSQLAVRRRARTPVGRFAATAAPALAPIGKWWGYGPAALGAAAFVSRSRSARETRRAAAATLALAPAAAFLAARALDRWAPQPFVALPRRRPVTDTVFPSGHALATTAVALSTAYVLIRERLARPGSAWPAALAIATGSGAGRIIQGRHLGSDVVGGWLAGVAVAAGCAGAYELARERGSRRRPAANADAPDDGPTARRGPRRRAR